MNRACQPVAFHCRLLCAQAKLNSPLFVGVLQGAFDTSLGEGLEAFVSLSPDWHVLFMRACRIQCEPYRSARLAPARHNSVLIPGVAVGVACALECLVCVAHETNESRLCCLLPWLSDFPLP